MATTIRDSVQLEGFGMSVDPNAQVPSPEEVVKASDPSTAAADLADLAFKYPSLQVAVALNPNAYPELLQWLQTYGDASVASALQQRATYGPYYPQPGYGVPVVAPEARAEAESQPEATSPVEPEPAPVGEPEPTAVAEMSVEPQPEPEPEPAPIVTAEQQAARHVPPVVVASAGAAEPEPTVQIPAVVAAAAPAPSYPPQYQNVPYQAAPEEPQPKKRSGNRNKFIVLGVLAFIAVALLAWIFFLIEGFDRDTDAAPGASPSTGVAESSQSPSEDASASPSASTSATPSSTPSETAKEVKYPAPANAIKTKLVMSPTGNLVCSLGEKNVTCLVKDSTGKVGQTCAASPLVVQAGESGTALACGTSMPAGSAVKLEYGKPATFGEVACVSRYSGVTCWNTVSGNALAVSRAGWQSGTNGEIPESAFSWNK